jgi:hypothetical protein
VELPAIDLDHDSLAAPQEIDLVVLVAEEDVTIDLGLGEAGPRAEVAKAPFEAAGRDVLAEIATGEYGAEVADTRPAVRACKQIADRVEIEESLQDSLLACSLELGLGREGRQVEQGARTAVTGMPWISVTSVALSSGRRWT